MSVMCSRIDSPPSGHKVDHFSFLLARLHLDQLADQLTLYEVHEQLKRLPVEINQTYDDIMERIDKQGEKKRVAARTILSWVVFARRALSVKEIKHALAVRAGDETLIKGRRRANALDRRYHRVLLWARGP
jgi:hypothetical protein